MRRHEAIEATALDWLIQREGSDWTDEMQAELDVWLDESIAHKAAYWRSEHGWRQADRVRSLGFDNDDLPAERRPALNGWVTAIAASVLAMATVSGIWVAPGFFQPQEQTQSARRTQQMRFDTLAGGGRHVSLADGSKIELSTRSVLRTAVGERKREVWLDQGKAYFDVAKRAGEPFVVHLGSHKITVLGTKFSVLRGKDRLIVSVLEGRVRVDNGSGDLNHAAIIAAGDTMIASEASTLITSRSERPVESASSRDQVLRFDRAPLSRVAAEFNRHNRKQLVIADPVVGQILIGGSFRASNVDSFVRLLRDAYDLTVTTDKDTVKIST